MRRYAQYSFDGQYHDGEVLAVGAAARCIGRRTAIARRQRWSDGMGGGGACEHGRAAESVGVAEAEAKAGEQRRGRQDMLWQRGQRTRRRWKRAKQTRLRRQLRKQHQPQSSVAAYLRNSSKLSIALYQGRLPHRLIGLFSTPLIWGRQEVFANSSMSVFHLFQTQVTLKNRTKQSGQLLSTPSKYSSIYLMLRINELGYTRNRAPLRPMPGRGEQIRTKQPQGV